MIDGETTEPVMADMMGKQASSLVPMAKATLSGRAHLYQDIATSQMAFQGRHTLPRPNAETSSLEEQTRNHHQAAAQNNSSWGRSFTVCTQGASISEANKQKIATQADLFLRSKKKYSQQGRGVEVHKRHASNSSQTGFEQAQMRSYANKTFSHPAAAPRDSCVKTNVTSARGSNLGGPEQADPRDQLIISKEHAVPRQPLQLQNSFAPRLNPKTATSRTSLSPSKRLPPYEQSKATSRVSFSKSLGRSAQCVEPVESSNGTAVRLGSKGAVVNVEVVFDTDYQQSQTIDLLSSNNYSRRDQRILTLRNSEDRSSLPSPAVIHQAAESFRMNQQRAQSTLQNAKRHVVTWKQNSVKKQSQAQGQKRVVVRPGPPQAMTINVNRSVNSYTTKTVSDTNEPLAMDSVSDTSPLQEASLSPRVQSKPHESPTFNLYQQLTPKSVLLNPQGATEPETGTKYPTLGESAPQEQTIIHQVTVGEDQKSYLMKQNPLRQQEVKHAFFKNEMSHLKPLAKYAYDTFGSMVNQHREKRTPTVRQTIQQADEDLQSQIRNQAQYLLQVMSSRLQADYNTPKYLSSSHSLGKSPVTGTGHTQFSSRGVSNKNYSPCQNAVKASASKKLAFSDLQQKEMKLQRDTDQNQVPQDAQLLQLGLKSLAQKQDDQVSASKIADETSFLIQQLYGKMRWQQLEVDQKSSLYEESLRKGFETAQLEDSQDASGSYPPQSQAQPHPDYALPSARGNPVKHQKGVRKQSQSPKIRIQQQAAASKEMREQSHSRRSVPNSQVPEQVLPVGEAKSSSVLRNRLVKVGSTTSSELDQNILYKMKEFELLGQQLFNIQPRQKSPSSASRRDKSPQVLNVFNSLKPKPQEEDKGAEVAESGRFLNNQSELVSYKKLENFRQAIADQPHPMSKLNSMGRVDGQATDIDAQHIKNRSTLLRLTRDHSQVPVDSKKSLGQNKPLDKTNAGDSGLQELSSSMLVEGVSNPADNLRMTEVVMATSQHLVAQNQLGRKLEEGSQGAGRSVAKKREVKVIKSKLQGDDVSVRRQGETDTKMSGKNHSENNNGDEVLVGVKNLHSSKECQTYGESEQSLSSPPTAKKSPRIQREERRSKKQGGMTMTNSPRKGTTNVGAQNVAEDAFSTSTLLQGDQSVIAIQRQTSGLPMSNQFSHQPTNHAGTQLRADLKTFTSSFPAPTMIQVDGHRVIQESNSLQEMNSDQRPTGHVRSETIGLADESNVSLPEPVYDQSDASGVNPQTQTQNRLSESQNRIKTTGALKLTFLHCLHSNSEVFKSQVDIQEVLKESSKAELTASEFHQLCLTKLLASRTKADAKRKGEPLVHQLNTYEVSGEPVTSILDWMQKPLEAQQAELTLLVLGQGVKVSDVVKKLSGSPRPYPFAGLRTLRQSKFSMESQQAVQQSKEQLKSMQKQGASSRSSLRSSQAHRGQQNSSALMRSGMPADVNPDFLCIGRQSPLPTDQKKAIGNAPRRKVRATQSPKTKWQKQDEIAGSIKGYVAGSNDTGKLGEDSIYSEGQDRKAIADKQATLTAIGLPKESADDLYQPSLASERTLLQPQINQVRATLASPSYINVTEESSHPDLLAKTFDPRSLEVHLKQPRKGGESRTRLLTSHQKLNQQSKFHNYVCQTLLEQIQRPVKQVSLEEKMSNPASLRRLKASTSTKIQQDPSESQAKSKASQQAIKRFLENYYKKPIELQAMRLSTSPNLGCRADQSEYLLFENQTIQAAPGGSHFEHRLPSVQILKGASQNQMARTHNQSRFMANRTESLRASLPHQNLASSSFTTRCSKLTGNTAAPDQVTASRNRDMRMQTLTQHTPHHLRVKIGANKSKVSQTPLNEAAQDEGQDPGAKFATTATTLNKATGGLRSSNSTYEAVQKQSTRQQSSIGTAAAGRNARMIMSKTIDCSSANSPPIKRKYTMPASFREKPSLVLRQSVGGGTTAASAVTPVDPVFIPARAIKVPLPQARLRRENDKDFSQMKNLFLANCLKLKEGEAALSESKKKAMSSQIKAFKGPPYQLTPLRQRQTKQ